VKNNEVVVAGAFGISQCRCCDSGTEGH